MVTARRDALDAARRRRHALRDAMVSLEAAATAPVASPDWPDALRERIESVGGALRDHITEVESPKGIIARAVGAAPRLESHAAVLRRDHEELSSACGSLLRQIGAMEPADGSAAVATRERCLDFLGNLSRHRQRGADLVYEAFQMDVGGPG